MNAVARFYFKRRRGIGIDPKEHSYEVGVTGSKDVRDGLQGCIVDLAVEQDGSLRIDVRNADPHVVVRIGKMRVNVKGAS